VSNGGPDPVSGVRVTDDLPAGTTFVSATPSQGTCSGTTKISCSLGSIASGAGAGVEIVVKTTQAGTLTNSASVSGEQVDPNSANNSATATTTVKPAADLSVTKTDSPDPVHVGQPLLYTIVVSNNGPYASSAVTATDTLPKNAGYGSFTTTKGSCTLKPEKALLSCTLGDMAANTSAMITITVKPSARGTITNTVTVASSGPNQTPDPTIGNNTASATTAVMP
jgi:uncharacterized repeat protein (TIGR01451 family)